MSEVLAHQIATHTGFVALVDELYEAGPWLAERAWRERPFASAAALKACLARTVREASRDEQVALLRVPADCRNGVAARLAASADATGPMQASPADAARLRELGDDYAARFGWPFVPEVSAPPVREPGAPQMLEDLRRRLDNPMELELVESLRQLHRIAELRLNRRLGLRPLLGEQVLEWCELLAEHSEPPWQAQGKLTVTYLSAAHRACAARLRQWMVECGFDEVHLDAIGNVVGIYHAEHRDAPRLLTGSHYDTVRDAGRLDGRVGILVPMLGVRELARARRRLPFGIEVVGFAEEEGQRFQAAFLGSSALVGSFDPAWLELRDEHGVRLREAMIEAGLPGTMEAIRALRRDPARYLGFVEVHIEQGPVLESLDLPLGIVHSINASARAVGEVVGMAAHAGTTPMDARRDAACAVAELILLAERSAAQAPGAVATVGQLEVPGGSVNVVPGRCRFSLDVRAPDDALRDRVRTQIEVGLREVCARRGLRMELRETLREPAAPSDAGLQARWERALEGLGVPVLRMSSGAGHDAMKMHRLLPQAMLFVRGAHGGISHNALESSTADDLHLACQAFQRLLEDFRASC
ncbi:hydantoinase/carbamoylase family amidase [Thiomonas sp.]|jgi:N-carbamoyl-L-amino-acid hydrolase|uniref:hydantoinase/carbamoylase family amidase n=1 Tax=Thiomonas sp. TaxID=2047785 RepID=UPI0026107D76|nr:hydantoinase/carbamoylase family amidase [Thiomonas sp.]